MKCHIYQQHEFNTLDLRPGDFILTHGNDLFDRLIQIFTMSTWNHAALIANKDGDIVELVSSGIKKHNLQKYKNEQSFLVRIDFSDQDQQEIINYTEAMLRRHEKYGFLTIFSIALKIVTKSRLIIKLDGTQICSEFVANALARGGVVWDSDTSLITPADLYNLLVRGKKETDLH